MVDANNITWSTNTSHPDDQSLLVLYEFARSPLTSSGYLLSSIYLTIIGCLATAGNSTVIYVIVRSPKFRSKPHNMLLLNMAIADACISIFGYPFTTASGYAHRWLFGNIGCTICGFVCFTFALTSMNTLAVIGVYRYYIVCKPQYLITQTHTIYAIIGTWVYSLLWTSPPLFGWSKYTFEPFGTSCSVYWDGRSIGDVSYSVCLTIFCFIVHLVALCYCYRKVWQVSRKLDPHRLSKNPTSLDVVMRAQSIQAESKPTQMSIAMIVSYLVCWFPYAGISIWAALVAPIPDWLSPLPTFFCKASCAVNPLIYAATNTAFRQALVSLCPRRFHRVGDRSIEIANVQNKRYKNTTLQFTVDRTKEGIFIGQQQLSLELREEAF